METKEELVNNIKEWIKVDCDISKLQSELKAHKLKKKQISDALMMTMKKNQIDCFDINGGSLVYKKTMVKKTLNKKSLFAAIQGYTTDATAAEALTKHILNSREEKEKETITRKIEKG